MANSITKEYVQSRIIFVEFIDTGKNTVCFMTLNNSYQIIGSSGTVNPLNFDIELGRKYAYQDAFNKAWAHLAFLEQETDYTPITEDIPDYSPAVIHYLKPETLVGFNGSIAGEKYNS